MGDSLLLLIKPYVRLCCVSLSFKPMDGCSFKVYGL